MPKKYMGVTGAVGLPGSGKSYFLAEKAVKAMRAGIPTYSNAGFDVEGTETLRSFQDFVSVQGPAVVVWDELPLYFAARKWQSFPDGMLYKLTQIRKDGVELYYSTIHPRLVDVVLRSITFVWVDCRHVRGRLIRRVYKPPEEFGEKDIYWKEFGWMRKGIMRAYDTYGRVEVHDAARLAKLPEGEWARPAWGANGGDPAPAGGGGDPVAEQVGRGTAVEAVPEESDDGGSPNGEARRGRHVRVRENGKG